MYEVIDLLREQYNVSELCDYFGFPRTSYYAWIRNGRPQHKCFDKSLAKLILELFEQHQKGYRYITYQLLRKYGIILNPKTVLRYMQILGIKSPIRKRRFIHTTLREVNEKARHVHNNVLARNFKASRPRQKLVTDISYLYHRKGRMFISVIKDLYDNSIISYSLSNYNGIQLVFETLEILFNEKWDSKQECILHSDQGFQYTNIAYINVLESFGVTISHSRKANCLDNSPCENFFSHLKSESISLNIPQDQQSLIKQVHDYITWYNYDRPQQKLKGMTPIEFRDSYLLY